jgi:hypothetical protein
VVEELIDTLPEARETLRAAARAADSARAAARAAGADPAAGRGGRAGFAGGGARGGGGAAGGRAGGRGGPPACAWPLSEPGMRCGFVRTGKFVSHRMPVRDRFDATLSVKLPVAWLLPKFPGSDSVVAQLRRHGVVVEQLTARLDARGERFAIDTVIARPPQEGDSGLRLEGAWAAVEHLAAESGDHLVRAAQPLGVLAAVMLEPQSDDGLVTWHFFTPALDALRGAAPGARTFPVVRVTAAVTAPMRLVP